MYVDGYAVSDGIVVIDTELFRIKCELLGLTRGALLHPEPIPLGDRTVLAGHIENLITTLVATERRFMDGDDTIH